MTTPVDTARSAIYGTPPDPAKKPNKSLIVQAFDEAWTGFTATASGALVRDTKANLDMVLAANLHQMAWVTGDATSANNGVYENTGTTMAAVWTRRTDLPTGMIPLTNVGAGTANAIETTSSFPAPSAAGRALFILPIHAGHTNTSATVTLSNNSETPKPVKSMSGANPPIGGIVAGVYYLVADDGTNYRILTEMSGAAYQAACETAQAAAEAARDQALGAVPAVYTNTLVTLAQLDPGDTTHAYVDDTTGAGVAGQFRWDGSDLSSSVDAIDVVAPGAGNPGGLATDGSEGAWVRVFDRQPDPISANFSVSIPTDYADMQTAFNAVAALKVNPGVIITINIETGEEISEGLTVDSGSHAHIRFTSTDATVKIAADFASSIQAVTFDGAANYLQRSSDLTGNADGKAGTFSGWFRFSGADGSTQQIIEARTGSDAAPAIVVQRDSSNKIHITGDNAGGTKILELTSSASHVIADGWFHVLASWDLATGVGQLYIDDVSDLAGGSTLTNDTLDYTQSKWTLGARHLSSADRFFNGDMADVVFALEHVDLSVTANRRKFIDAGGDPVPLGNGGHRPFASLPIFCFNGRAINWNINYGAGGSASAADALFTLTGSDLAQATAPDGTDATADSDETKRVFNFRSCFAPHINFVVDCDRHAYQGCDAVQATCNFDSGGCINSIHDGIETNTGNLYADGSSWDGSGERGIQVNGGMANLSNASADGSVIGLSGQGSGTILASYFSAQDCYSVGIRANRGSSINAVYCDVRGFVDDGLQISDGGFIAAPSATTRAAAVGTPNVDDTNIAVFNTLYASGIIFA